MTSQEFEAMFKEEGMRKPGLRELHPRRRMWLPHEAKQLEAEQAEEERRRR
jgi:hypothetical protein